MARITPVAGLRAISSHGLKNSCGNQGNFLWWAKISFHAAFRAIRIATDSNSILCYVTISNNMRLMQIKAKTKRSLVEIAVFFDSNSQRINFNISSTQRLYSKGCGIYHVSLSAFTDTHRAPFQNFLIYGVDGLLGK